MTFAGIAASVLFGVTLVLDGLILFFAGWELLKESAFALLLMVLAIPLPVIVFNQGTIR